MQLRPAVVQHRCHFHLLLRVWLKKILFTLFPFGFAFAELPTECKKLKSLLSASYKKERKKKKRRMTVTIMHNYSIQSKQQRQNASSDCFPASPEQKPLFSIRSKMEKNKKINKKFRTLLHISSGREQCSPINSTNKLSAGNDPVVFSLHKYSKFWRINMD